MPKITKSFVENIDQPGYYKDTELIGFYVRAYNTKSGLNKFYIVNGKMFGTGKSVSVSLGRHGVVTAEKARIDAKQVLAHLAQGLNPNQVKRKERKARQEQQQLEIQKEERNGVTLQALLKDYLAARRLKHKTQLDYVRFLKRCVPDWLNKPIANITRDMVQERHLAISKKHPAQANLTMRILRALFTYAAAVYEDEKGQPLIQINPVDRLKHARLWNRVARRQSVIRNHQLAAWYQAVLQLANSSARDILLMELFTGFRHSEAMSLKWENVDLDCLTIKITDTKNHNDHMLPISVQLESILQARRQAAPANDIYVFPGGGRAGHITEIRDSIRQVIQISGVSFTEHDLRRTFETTAESLDISYYTLKALLNHKTGSDPTAGYIITSAERMRDAVQKVATRLDALMNQLPDDVETAKKQ